jgi:hypothetical protein
MEIAALLLSRIQFAFTTVSTSSSRPSRSGRQRKLDAFPLRKFGLIEFQLM